MRTRAAYRCFLRGRSRLQLKLPPFLALAVFSLAPAPVACQQTQEQMSQPPLEVRLTTPSWQKGSLKVGVDCVNHSSTLRYLPVMGTYISLAVNEAATESVSWGHTDCTGNRRSQRLLPTPWRCCGQPKKETRRGTPTRAKLRVEAFYFLSEVDWQENKHYHEVRSSEHTKPSTRPEFLKPQSATCFARRKSYRPRRLLLRRESKCSRQSRWR
jgi:hypothetical protein